MEALSESSHSFEVAATRTSALVNLAFSRETEFVREHAFIDVHNRDHCTKRKEIRTIGVKQYPSIMQRMLNKRLPPFMQSTPTSRKRKKGFAGRVLWQVSVVKGEFYFWISLSVWNDT